MLKRIFRADVIAAATLLVVGLTYGFLTASLSTLSLPNTPGPAFFPWLITAGLLLLSAILLVQSLADDRREPTHTSTGPISFRRPLMLGLFCAFLVLLPVAGFLAAGIPFVAGLVWLYGERNWLVLTAAGILVPVSVLYIFRSGFNILLPTGFW